MKPLTEPEPVATIPGLSNRWAIVKTFKDVLFSKW